MNAELLRRIALLGFALVLASFSLSMWKLPLFILFPGFHETYLVPSSGHPYGYFIGLWFLIGGYKTSLIMAWDKHEEFFQSLNYQLKAILFVPFAPFIKFKTTWYKLPTI